MDKQKQIEEMAKLEIEESAGFYSAFINDMRISQNKPASVSKTIMTFRCPKKYILQAIGIPENAVVLTRGEHQKYLAFKIIEPQVRGCLDREYKLEKQVQALDDELNLAKRVLSYDDAMPLAKWEEKVRKETAEKFAERLEEVLVNYVPQECIDEICKEIIGETK